MTSLQLIISTSCSTVSTVMAEQPLYCLREHICKYYWQYSCFALLEAMTINGMTSVLETGALPLQQCCAHAALIFWPNSSVLHSSDTYPHTSRCVLHSSDTYPHTSRCVLHICRESWCTQDQFVPSCPQAACMCSYAAHMCNLHVCSTNSSTYAACVL